MMRYKFLLFCTSVIFSNLLFAQTADIDVNVYNIKDVKGNLHIALFNKSANFPFEKGVIETYIVKVRSKNCNYRIKNLPKGDYAVVVYHDKNSDGSCNKFLGIPTEAYGFSNNIRPKFSAPDFNDCKFALNTTKSLFIKIN
jgi:uncharacterized protein (DUF2141 family)